MTGITYGTELHDLYRTDYNVSSEPTRPKKVPYLIGIFSDPDHNTAFVEDFDICKVGLSRSVSIRTYKSCFVYLI